MGSNRQTCDRRRTKRPGSWDRRGNKRIRSPRSKDAVIRVRRGRAAWKKRKREKEALLS